MGLTATRWILAAGGALALAFVSLPRHTDAEAEAAAAPPGVCEAKTRPADLSFTVNDMHGKPVKFADYKGKVILLDFWATWCPPCKVEMPWFVEFQEKYGPRGFQVLGVSVDDAPDKLKAFAQEFKVNYPLLVGRDREEIQDAYGPIYGIPVTFIIDREGRICRRHMGIGSKERFQREIEALL